MRDADLAREQTSRRSGSSRASAKRAKLAPKQRRIELIRARESSRSLALGPHQATVIMFRVNLLHKPAGCPADGP